jgi:hypothetical protein
VLDLDVTKDSIGEPTAAGPAIHTKHVQTRVEVEDGGTVAIGGIYEQLRRDDVTRAAVGQNTGSGRAVPAPRAATSAANWSSSSRRRSSAHVATPP